MNQKETQQYLPNLRKHYESAYLKIHQQLRSKWFRYVELFFIVGSLASIIYSSFEESAPYRKQLFTFNYIASFVFTIEYILRLISAPMKYPRKRTWQSRLKYIFSFYGIIDFVAILPFVVIYVYQDSPHLHLVALAYILIIFKLIRYSRSFQLIGKVLQAVREELLTAYTACGIMLCFSGILMYYIEKRSTTGSVCKHWWRTLVGHRSFYDCRIWRHIPHHSYWQTTEQPDQPNWNCHDCHPNRYYQLRLYEHVTEQTKE